MEENNIKYLHNAFIFTIVNDNGKVYQKII